MTEERLHRSVVAFLRVALPPECFWTAVQPGGRDKAINAKRKGLGVVAGVPDFLIFYPASLVSNVVKAVGIELKSATGRVSPAQVETMARMRTTGFHTAVCRSLPEVEAALKLAGIPLKARAA